MLHAPDPDHVARGDDGRQRFRRGEMLYNPIKGDGGNAMTGLTLSYVHGASDQPLIGQTIGQFFDAVCERCSDRPALVVRHQKLRLSYGELRQEVDRLAPGF